QAEDGIRDFHVTGVQTCALPISAGGRPLKSGLLPFMIIIPGGSGQGGGSNLLYSSLAGRMGGSGSAAVVSSGAPASSPRGSASRSEERRAGKEWRTWQARRHYEK